MANRFLGRHFVWRVGAGLIVVGAPAVVRAANNCPWMNEATASALLGGNSVGAYHASTENQPGVCTFTQNDGDVTRVLRITLDVVKDDPHAHWMKSGSACGPNPTSLKAIGNEAVACVVDVPTEGRRARVIGRVRDQVFEILITTTGKNDQVLKSDALRIRINTAAEQVSGNLF